MRVRTGRCSRLNRPAVPRTQQAFAVGAVGFVVYGRRGGCPAPEVVTNPPLGTLIKARRVEVFDPLGDQEADDHRLAPESEWVALSNVTTMGEVMCAGFGDLDAALAWHGASLLAALDAPRGHGDG